MDTAALGGLCAACLMRQALSGVRSGENGRAGSGTLDFQVDTHAHVHVHADEFVSAVSFTTWMRVTVMDDDEECVTYLARGPQLGRLVLVKQPVDAKELDAARERIIQRCDALRSVRHPALAEVLDGGITDDGHAFLVTPFVMAAPLAGTALLDEALEAIRALHAAGVPHGRVRDTTILAHRARGRATAVVTGFAPLPAPLTPDTAIQRDLEQFQQLAATVRV